jgi:hypothetical protein
MDDFVQVELLAQLDGFIEGADLALGFACAGF